MDFTNSPAVSGTKFPIVEPRKATRRGRPAKERSTGASKSAITSVTVSSGYSAISRAAAARKASSLTSTGAYPASNRRRRMASRSRRVFLELPEPYSTSTCGERSATMSVAHRSRISVSARVR